MNLGQSRIKASEESGAHQLHILVLTYTGFWWVKTIDVAACVRAYLDKEHDFADRSPEQERFLKVKDVTRDGVARPDSVTSAFAGFADLTRFDYQYQINDAMDVAVRIVERAPGDRKGAAAASSGVQAAAGKSAIQNIIQQRMRALVKKPKDIGELVYIQKRECGMTPEGEQRVEGLSVVLHSMLRISATQSRRSRSGSMAEAEPPKEEEDTHPGEDLFWTHSYKPFRKGTAGFAMNRSRVYFWNDFRIWSYNLLAKPEGVKYMGPEVDRDNKQTSIKYVRTGSVEDKVGIIIKQSATMTFSCLWDTNLDCEMEAFDHGLHPKLFWDQEGSAYATEKDLVYFTDMGLRMKCFDVLEINEGFDTEGRKVTKRQKAFGTHQGFKFDSKSHSWLYLQGFISLAYSYMTFVINKKLALETSQENDDYLFDTEQYNYIIQRRTALSRSTLIRDPK